MRVYGLKHGEVNIFNIEGTLASAQKFVEDT